MKNIGLNGYLLFIISWFLHLPARIPLLGVLRADLVLVAVLSVIAFAKKPNGGIPSTKTDRLIKILILYSILTVPFVEWPGSVFRNGIPELVKAIVFYYFTIAFVQNERDLKKMVYVFLACQLFRILEPLFLHITEGYWGSVTSMANWEYLDRLSGAPNDVVNPNGLAFVVCTVLPFLYFMSGLSWINWLLFASLVPACLYVLVLTGSRSGILGLVVIYLGILVKSKRRLLWGLSGVLVVIIGFPLLSPDMQDRYLSIIGKGAKNEGSVEYRTEGMIESFDVAIRRPIFGYGLGTSREANANFAGHDQPAHNLYLEVAEELGFVGLVIFLFFMRSIFASFAHLKRAYEHQDSGTFLSRIVDAMQVWLWMDFVFSFASYGLSSYEWYLLGGFSVLLQRLTGGEIAKKDINVHRWLRKPIF